VGCRSSRREGFGAGMIVNWRGLGWIFSRRGRGGMSGVLEGKVFVLTSAGDRSGAFRALRGIGIASSIGLRTCGLGGTDP
jgi:hypothetical protein